MSPLSHFRCFQVRFALALLGPLLLCAPAAAQTTEPVAATSAVATGDDVTTAVPDALVPVTLATTATAVERGADEAAPVFSREAVRMAFVADQPGSALSLRARVAACAAGQRAAVTIDGRSAGTVAIKDERARDYTVKTPVSAGRHTLELSMSVKEAGCRKALEVQRVSVVPDRRSPHEPGVPSRKREDTSGEPVATPVPSSSTPTPAAEQAEERAIAGKRADEPKGDDTPGQDARAREAEASRRADEARKAIAAREAREARAREEAAAREAQAREEAARKSAETRRAREEREAEEAREREEASRRAADARKAEEARRTEEARKAEEARKREEADRKAAEARKAEEARKREEADRKAAEARGREESKRRGGSRPAPQPQPEPFPSEAVESAPMVFGTASAGTDTADRATLPLLERLEADMLREAWDVGDLHPGHRSAAGDRRGDLFRDAAARDITILPVLRVLESDVATAQARAATLRWAADWAATYAAGGTHWRGRADAELAPTHLELGNEPYGEAEGWTAAAFGAFVHEAAAAMRAANPNVRVLVPVDVSEESSGVIPAAGTPDDFIAGMYSGGFVSSDADAFAVHSLAVDPSRAVRGDRWALKRLETIHARLAERGALDAPIWVTSLAVPTRGETGSASAPGTYTEAQQAQWITQAIDQLAAHDFIAAVFAARLRDGSPYGTSRAPADYAGLQRSDGSAKPAFEGFRKAIAKRRVAEEDQRERQSTSRRGSSGKGSGDVPAALPEPAGSSRSGSSKLFFDGLNGSSTLSRWGRQESGSSGRSHGQFYTADPTGVRRNVIELRTDESQSSGDVVRSQIVSPGMFKPGDDRWIVSEHYLPSSLPRVSNWFTLTSHYGSPHTTSSPMPFQLRRVGGEERLTCWGEYSGGSIWSVPTPRGRWFVLARRVRFSRSSGEGFVEIAYAERGSPLRRQTLRGGSTRFNLATLEPGVNDGGTNTLRFANYHAQGMSGWSGSNSVYVGRARVYDGSARLEDIDPYHQG